jgi:hypothetical protein
MLNEVVEAKEPPISKPPWNQKMLKWLQWFENWTVARKLMLLNDDRFQILPKDWKRPAGAQNTILELQKGREEWFSHVISLLFLLSWQDFILGAEMLKNKEF